MSLITTIEYEGIKFDVYADVEPADHSVGYNGGVDIYCICLEHDPQRTDLSAVLDEQFQEYVYGEACIASESLAQDDADERAEREWEDREDR